MLTDMPQSHWSKKCKRFNRVRIALLIHWLVPVTVNLEIFARILFSQIALKDIFATIKISTLE